MMYFIFVSGEGMDFEEIWDVVIKEGKMVKG